MTRAQSVAHWSGVPSLSHLWMAALLRLAAMLVSNAAHPLRMLLTLLSRECHTDVERDRLPAMESGNCKEEETAATHSQTAEALMLRGREAIVSKHECALTNTSPCKGEVGASEAGDGRGSLRPTLADQWDPHPSLASQKLTSPLQGEVKTAPA